MVIFHTNFLSFLIIKVFDSSLFARKRFIKVLIFLCWAIALISYQTYSILVWIWCLYWSIKYMYLDFLFLIKNRLIHNFLIAYLWVIVCLYIWWHKSFVLRVLKLVLKFQPLAWPTRYHKWLPISKIKSKN